MLRTETLCRRSRRGLPALCLLWLCLTGWLVTACQDDEAGYWSASEGRCTLNLKLRSRALVTRADDAARDSVDLEFYIQTVDLFFYPLDAATDTAVIEMRNQTIAVDSAVSLSYGLSYDIVDRLFPDTVTQCLVYAVANLSDSLVRFTRPTIDTVQSLVLYTDFPNTENERLNFAMDAVDTLTLNRSKMTVSGAIALERAMSKILLSLAVADSVRSNGKLYTSVWNDEAVVAELYNGATRGCLHGAVSEASGRGFTGKENSYLRYYTPTGEVSERMVDTTLVTYQKYTHIPFFSYPNEWTSNFEDQETAIRLQVPWQTEEGDFITYYYQIPINYRGKKLERNHYYKISLTVGMLGSADPSDPVEIPDPDYEILDWGTGSENASNEKVSTGETEEGESEPEEEEAVVDAQLAKDHYLVVDDTKFTLWNAGTLSFNYSTCANLEGAYLVDVYYETTKYPNSDGSARKVYLYRTEYNTKTKKFVEISSYETYDKQVRSDFSSVVTFINNQVKNGTIVVDNPDQSTDGTYEGSGTVVFTADIDQVAGVVYRPVTFTIALVNDLEHEGTIHKVAITQYPSKYIEIKSGGEVFVNGYYARLSNGNLTGALSHQDNYYRSYSFIYSGYTSSVSADGSYTGYYSSSSNAASSVTWYGYSGSNNFTSNSQKAVNASYEYVRGALGGTNSITYVNMLQIHVAAFTSDDHSFTVQVSDVNNNVSTDEYDFAISDPREAGGFVADQQHNTSDYVYEATSSYGDYLYDYLVKGQYENKNYNRYVHSWDNAAAIMVGGTSTAVDNVIAPAFIIQSSYGAASATTYFKIAQKRCATYQEMGYPAGRWRLPTLAELAFILSLQKNGTISAMFDTSSGQAYWTSSGGGLQPQSSGNDVYYKEYVNKTSAKRLCNVRCVYDTWFWGDSAEDATQYNPKP